MTELKGINIGLFDYDRHNALYFFILNGDEEIYLRYGGRDSVSPDSYLSLDSLELALQRGLELHDQWKEGNGPAWEAPEPFYPEQMPLLQEKEVSRGRCVECHMIGDYQAAQLELDGNLDKAKLMFPSPDLKKLGIELDVPKGLLVDAVSGMAEAAGLQPGDTIAGFEEHKVYTFGDLQHRFGKHARDATSARLVVDRPGSDEPIELTMQLEPLWWVTDIDYRYWSVDPQAYFGDEPLSAERKAELELPEDALACKVTSVNPRAAIVESHALQVGDEIVAVGGETRHGGLGSCGLYIKINVKSGETVTLDVLRAGEKISMPLKTHRQYYRKNK